MVHTFGYSYNDLNSYSVFLYIYQGIMGIIIRLFVWYVLSILYLRIWRIYKINLAVEYVFKSPSTAHCDCMFCQVLWNIVLVFHEIL